MVFVTDINEIFVIKDNALVAKTTLNYSLKDVEMAISTALSSKTASLQMGLEEGQKAILKISCICSTKNGFIVGFDGIGVISLYDLDKGDKIAHKGFFQIKEEKFEKFLSKEEKIMKIHSLHAGPDDMYLGVSCIIKTEDDVSRMDQQTKGSQESSTSYGRMELYFFNIVVIEAIKMAYKDPFEPLFDIGVHKGPILSIAVCPARSILMTLGDDQ